MKARERVLRMLLRVLARPYIYTRRELRNHFDVSEDTMRDDIRAIKAAGIKFEQETSGRYRCAVLPDTQFDELRYLQSLTEEERGRIGNLLNQYLPKREAFYLKQKLSSLYDFQQLGLNALRRPALEKLNLLESAKKKELQVIFENYRSNSNEIKDRILEVFEITPELDTVQAFDPEEKRTDKQIKHFKLSRIERVRITDTPWTNKAKHKIKTTDVFRIAMNNQKMVHLKMDVYAYNSLIDNYPKAKGECMPGTEQNTFDFQSKVNPKFLGLTNFIMNNAGHVEIISPMELKEKVRERVNILLESLG